MRKHQFMHKIQRCNTRAAIFTTPEVMGLLNVFAAAKQQMVAKIYDFFLCLTFLSLILLSGLSRTYFFILPIHILKSILLCYERIDVHLLSWIIDVHPSPNPLQFYSMQPLTLVASMYLLYDSSNNCKTLPFHYERHCLYVMHH